MKRTFALARHFTPTGDQPSAIAELTQGVKQDTTHQTLLGVTGSGKTFTIANVIAQTARPAVIMAPNKTLAAQLYSEFKQFFPNNAVEYFVSYYDYYQPEAYVPTSDTYIEKDASINEQIEQMRLSATQSILEREDTIIIASVSAIYGLGAPEAYLQMLLTLKTGEAIQERHIIKQLIDMQYTRSMHTIERGQFRARGEVIDIFPATSDSHAVRLELFDDTLETIYRFDPLTGQQIETCSQITIHPTSHYVAPQNRISQAIVTIEEELKERLAYYKEENNLVALQRLEQRTYNDLEMLRELGYCNGIENYSRHLSGRAPGEPPPTLFSYIPENTLVVLDESHLTVPQIDGMYKGDRARKESLVNYGFRLPSALDNRPMRFAEWQNCVKQMILVSATPSTFEQKHCPHFTQQIIRPTGIVDPTLDVRPAASQVDDLLEQIAHTIEQKGRTLVTVLTKKLAEQLTHFLAEHGIKTVYLHSDINTIERSEIIQQLRQGVYDVLVGINLLREGLDMPEVSLVAILDADKEGFLRSARSLIQTIGRAARNTQGRVILYADKTTPAMQQAMEETNRRRAIQTAYNKKHNITPQAIQKDIQEQLSHNDNKRGIQGEVDNMPQSKAQWLGYNSKQQQAFIKKLKKQMHEHAERLEFEQAATVRDALALIKQWQYM